MQSQSEPALMQSGAQYSRKTAGGESEALALAALSWAVSVRPAARLLRR